jgi:hypothetical protein
MGRTGEGIAPTHDRQRERNAEGAGDEDIDEPPAGIDHRMRHRRQRWNRRRRSTGRRHHAPHDQDRESGDADPDALRQRLAAKLSSHARVEPQYRHHGSGEHRRKIFGSNQSGEAPRRRRHDRYEVVTDDETGQRPEQQSLDECRAGGNTSRPWPEGRHDSGFKSAGHEQRPAFEVDRADERGQCGRREHEPAGGLTQCHRHDARHEERRNAKLRDDQRRGVPDGNEPQERRRRQDDSYRVTRRNG